MALEGLKYGRRKFRIFHQHGFGKLEFKIFSLQASFREYFVDALQKSAAVKFNGGNIYGNTFER